MNMYNYKNNNDMKNLKLTFLLTMLMSMVGVNSYGIAVENNDGVTIYYTFINNNKELSVSSGGYYSYSGNVIIPESVTYEGQTYSVTAIGESAFLGCYNLTSVIIPNSVTTIGYYAFGECEGLKSVNIPNSVITIGRSAFSGCTGLESVTIGATSIGDYAFSNCTGLESVVIGNGVTTIGDSPFNECTNLESVTLNSNAIASANYSSKKNICNIFGSQVTEYILGEDVTEIGEYAFYGCKNMTSVSFSDNLNKINNNAFKGCESLKTAVLTNNITEIGNYVFEGCSNMETITLSKNLSTIGWNAFKDCKSLSSIDIPYTLTTIGIYAFAGCEKLEKVIVRDLVSWCKISFKNEYANPLALAHHYYISENTEIEELSIPEGIGSIGKYAFYGASFIKSCVIPKDIKDVSPYAFAQCTSLSSIFLNDGIENIKEYAFYNCNKLEVVEIPNSVISIENYAFGDTHLNSLYVGTGVTSIASRAFWGDHHPIKTIWFSNTPPSGYTNAAAQYMNYVPNEEYTSIDSPCIYPHLSSYFVVDGVKYIPVSPSERTCDVIDCCYDNTSENINIGKEVIYKGIPMTVKNINSYAFVNNIYTKKVNLEHDGNISDDVFQNCTNIEELNIANNGGIGAGAFRECRGLKNVTIECSDDIGLSAFIDSDIHGTLKISNRGNIQSLAFNNVTGEYKAIVDNKGEISDNVFLNSTGLKHIIIGDDVTKLGYRVFYGCTELDSITIGSRVETIGKDAFYNCKKITKIVCRATTPPVCDVMALDDINKWNCTLSVPKGSLAAYQQAPQWKEFFYINDDVTPPTPVIYKLIYVVDGIEYKTYEIEEGATITPEPAPTKEGYTFSGWSEIPATMPAHDVTVTGTFTVNKYKLIYKVDGAEYKSYELEYGAKITPEPAPTKEGYTFSGWIEIPATMPAHDVTVTGSFTVNQYTITYIIDNEVYTTQRVDYGSTIIPPTAPEREGYDFAWGDYPETMPAYDIIIYGTYTTGIEAIMAGEIDCQMFSLDGKPLNELQTGVNIVRMSNGQVRKVVVK